MLEQRIQQQFFDSADLKYQSAEVLSRPVLDAVSAVLGCITSGGKLLLCGHGPSHAVGQLFAAQFVGRFERERPGLAALVLGSDAAVMGAVAEGADVGLAYAKQVQVLGSPGDVLVVIGAGVNAAMLVAAVHAAHAKDMTVIALTGREPGLLGAELAETDVHIAVPHDRAARIHEVHMLVMHCVCDAVDLQLMGEQDNA
jgi:D-sedoheptulose 7-phosphate isomerase